MSIERRSTPSAVGVISAPVRGKAATGSTLAGYAAVFGDITVIAGQFRERIARGAFAEAIGRDDCRCLLNHDGNIVLGRTKSGTLRLREDARGLHYSCDIDTANRQSMDVLAMVRRGDVSQSSFAFEVLSDDWERGGSRSDLPLRTIKAVRLWDVSPVTTPAYETTTVSAHSIAPAERAGAPRLSWRDRLEFSKRRLQRAIAASE